MLNNFIKTTLRALLRRKSHTAINVFGLSVGIACALIGYLSYMFNTTWDQQHAKKEMIYRVGTIREANNRQIPYGTIPTPVTSILRSEVEGIRNVTAIDRINGTVRIGESLFNESVWLTDGYFFEMFSFKAISGRLLLIDPDKVLISHTYAKKYFGDVNAVDKNIEVKINDTEWLTYTVGGIFEDMEKNSSIQSDIMIHISAYKRVPEQSLANWKNWHSAVFIEAVDFSVAQKAMKHLNNYVVAQNTANPDLAISGFRITPLSRVAVESRDVRNNSLIQNPPISSFVGTMVSAILVLLLACFNYINTTISGASSRLKEVGVRKVVGSSRKAIIFQFLSEQLLLCIVALFAGLFIAELMIQGWNQIWSFIPLSLNYSQEWKLILFMIVLVLSIALFAGFYPAWYISQFKPSQILRGQTVHARINKFMRSMLVLQFGLSLIAIIQALVFYRNAQYVQNIDLGYAKDQRISIGFANPTYFASLKLELEKKNGVESVVRGAEHIGFAQRRREVKFENKGVEAATYRVDMRYLDAMGLRLHQGRFFDPKLPTDTEESVVINREMARALGQDKIVGKKIFFEGAYFTVIGVTEDFLNRGVWEPPTPALFKTFSDQDISHSRAFIVVKTQSLNPSDAMELVRDVWYKVMPDVPFDGQFQDVVLAQAVQVSENIVIMNIWLGLICITLAGLGMYALVKLKTVRRTKEIGVRKVLGSTVIQIIGLINREFVLLMIVAMIVGDVLGYFSAYALINSIYSANSGVSLEAFLIANLIGLTVSITTATIVVYRAATRNPIISLRYE